MINIGISLTSFISSLSGRLSELVSNSFVAAYQAKTDVQNVGEDGNILNLMPKGDITATSDHSTTVLALDKDGVYRKYLVDAPVYKGGRVEFEKLDIDFNDWTITDVDVDNTIDVTVNTFRLVQANTNTISRIKSEFLTIGREYKLTSVLDPTSIGGLKFDMDGGSITLINGVITFTADRTRLELYRVTVPSNVLLTSLVIEDITGVETTYHDGLEVYAQCNKAATNLALWSNDLTQGAWNKRGGAIATLNEITIQSTSTNSVLSHSIAGLNVNGIFRVNFDTWSDKNITVLFELLDANDGIPEAGVTIDLTTTKQHVSFIVDMRSIGGFSGVLAFFINRTVAAAIGDVVGIENFMIEEISSVDEGANLFIPTTTAAASIPALDYVFPVANVPNSNDDSVINGGFDNGLIDWSYAGDSVVVVNGACEISRVATTTYIKQDICVPFESYLVEFDILAGSSGNMNIRVGGVGNHINTSQYTVGERYSKTFEGGSGVDFRIYSDQNDSTLIVDNITVRLADVNDAEISLNIDYQGDDTDVLDIGGVQLLEIGGFHGDGTEIATNGDLDDGLTGWLSGLAPSASMSVNASNQLEILSGAGDNPGAFSSAPSEIGVKYLIEFDVISCNSVGQARVGSSNAPDSGSVSNVLGSGEVVLGFNSVEWTGISNDAYMYFGGRDDVSSLVIDNFTMQKSVKSLKLSDGTSSIAMPISLGNNKVKARLTERSMYLEVDGVSASPLPPEITTSYSTTKLATVTPQSEKIVSTANRIIVDNTLGVNSVNIGFGDSYEEAEANVNQIIVDVGVLKYITKTGNYYSWAGDNVSPIISQAS